MEKTIIENAVKLHRLTHNGKCDEKKQKAIKAEVTKLTKNFDIKSFRSAITLDELVQAHVIDSMKPEEMDDAVKRLFMIKSYSAEQTRDMTLCAIWDNAADLAYGAKTDHNLEWWQIREHLKKNKPLDDVKKAPKYLALAEQFSAALTNTDADKPPVPDDLVEQIIKITDNPDAAHEVKELRLYFTDGLPQKLESEKQRKAVLAELSKQQAENNAAMQRLLEIEAVKKQDPAYVEDLRITKLLNLINCDINHININIDAIKHSFSSIEEKRKQLPANYQDEISKKISSAISNFKSALTDVEDGKVEVSSANNAMLQVANDYASFPTEKTA
ncbi:hypothetical protein AGMMS50267_04750 [Spirochaetia bacterium]|nr:hypothetical protein AGMMS50267_04750 [Spirochaetia bacterium]